MDLRNLFNPGNPRFFSPFSTPYLSFSEYIGMTEAQAKELLARYRLGKCTPEEKQALEQWIDSLAQKSEWNWTEAAKKDYEQLLRRNIELNTGISLSGSTPKTRIISFSWRRIAIAASVLILLGLGSYFIFFRNTTNSRQPVAINQPTDITAPQSTKATIILDNGRAVYLDTAGSGTLAVQGAVSVLKNDNGEIIYKELIAGSQELAYNTLSNPRGSQVVSLILSDGTKVWLNSESSLKYPVAFKGRERKVEITGEAYFEVAKDPLKKFIVNANNKGEVEVLGTHFNVNSYPDEASVKVTLLEGSVKVTESATHGFRFIKPGQQVSLANGALLTNNDINPEEIMAWKNGMFRLRETSLSVIMRQVQRWYDVEVEYKGITDKLTFYGAVGRKENVSELLKIMEKTGAVSFTIEGRKIIAEAR
jgi:transmembrane sensor